MTERDYKHGRNREGEPLAPLPEPEAILEAMPEGEWIRAQQIAMRLGVEGSQRLGVRASKGNWSGGMKAGVRLTHRLSAMHRRGLVDRRLDDHYQDTYEFRRVVRCPECKSSRTYVGVGGQYRACRDCYHRWEAS